MSETNAGRTVRKHFTSQPFVHYVRIEGAAAGTPDANVCVEGRDAWLEGKHIKSIPKREGTLVRFGTVSDSNKRLIHQANWLEARKRAQGRCFVWIRVHDTGTEYDGWYVMSDGFDRLYKGIAKHELAGLPLFPHAGAMVSYIAARIVGIR